MPGQRRRLAPDSFHQVAITTNRVDVVVENFQSRTIKIRCHPLAADGHSYAVSHALTERPGRGLNTRSDVRFRMPRSPAPQLAEALNLFHRDSKFFQGVIVFVYLAHFCQMQHGVQQHRRVAIREYKSVAIQPGRISGIVAQKFLPKAISNRRQSHRCPGMPRVGLLHRIDSQSSNRIDAQLVQLLACHHHLFTGHHATFAPCSRTHVRVRRVCPHPFRVLDYKKDAVRASVSSSAERRIEWSVKKRQVEIVEESSGRKRTTSAAEWNCSRYAKRVLYLARILETGAGCRARRGPYRQSARALRWQDHCE